VSEEPDSICEQCGAQYSHYETNADARFDFCSKTCEGLYWLAMEKEV
jgi:hypothetical protein